MAMFTKKPVTIEAFRWTGGPDQVEDPVWICDALREGRATILSPSGDGTSSAARMMVQTNHGEAIVDLGDWVIQQVDGEIYPCKDSVFQATYAPAKFAEHHKSYEGGGRGLTFGQAIEQLKAGAKVQRDGWNGKGMWLSLSGPLPGRQIAFENFWSTNNSEFARLNGGSATVLPCITMKTATGEILMGWLASQTDMLAEDWAVVA